MHKIVYMYYTKILVLLPNCELICKLEVIKKKNKMESTEIAICSTLLGLILALTDAYIERNIPG